MNALFRAFPLFLIACVAAVVAVAQGPEAPAPGNVSAGQISGVVLETFDVAPYTYVRLDSGEEEVWVAGPQSSVTVGSRVSASGGFPMRAFYSPTLKRTFDLIYFTSALDVEGQEGAVPSRPPTHAGSFATSPDAPNPHAESPGAALKRAATAAPAPAEASAVCAPEGGATIAGIHADKATLDGSEVLVRGVVTSFQPRIMGKNWIHIRDGSSGDQGLDLTVTTQDSAAIGNTVLVRGVLGLDRDFGHGYTYDLILEECSVSVEASPCPEQP